MKTLVATMLGISLVLAGTGWADMGKTAPALKAAPGSKAEAHNAEGWSTTTRGISTWR